MVKVKVTGYCIFTEGCWKYTLEKQHFTLCSLIIIQPYAHSPYSVSQRIKQFAYVTHISGYSWPNSAAKNCPQITAQNSFNVQTLLNRNI